MSDHASNLVTRLDQVRALIKRTAQETNGVGEIEESIKWGQASFATVRPKSGTPIRIGGNVEVGIYSIYVPCSTSLISDFRETHPDMFDYHGSRELRFDISQSLPKSSLELFISAALTYYLS